MAHVRARLALLALVLGSACADGVTLDPIMPYAVAYIGLYPGTQPAVATADAIKVSGTLAVQSNSTTLTIIGHLTGLEAEVSGGWHVHTGYTCETADDVGGHYFTAGEADPWTSVKYETDASGVARISLAIDGFSLQDVMAVAGRAIVVHNSTGFRVGCGLIKPTAAKLVDMGEYPDYPGVLTPRGLLTVQDTADGINIRGSLTGLEILATGGFHVHSGYTCDSAAGVFGHYFEAGTTDPWTASNEPPAVYISDARGVAEIDLTMANFTVAGEMPVLGRAIVAHLAAPNSTTRVACGLIGGNGFPGVVQAIATLKSYPGTYDAMRATFYVSEASGALRIDGVLSGLPADHTAGWHIHSGFSCDDHSLVEAHYFEGLDADPWTSANGFTYTSDAAGTAMVSHTLTLSDFTLTRTRPVLGRVFVVHNSTHRIGCGVLEPTSGEVAIVGAYPGKQSTMRGIVHVSSTTGESITLSGWMIGMEASASGGFHVHSGHTCESADGVFGHYYQPGTTDPWTPLNDPPAVYNSDAQGVAAIHLTMANFSLYSSSPVSQRAIVVHLANGDRSACGVLGADGSHAYDAYSSLGSYPAYAGLLSVSGTFSIKSYASTAMLHVDGVLGGLEPSTSGGWHIHEGYTCDDADLVGGHYFAGLTSDPWSATKWHSDASGNAVISTSMADFTTQPSATRSVLGRTIVVHSSTGTRVACGTVEPIAGGLVVKLGEYPTYTGSDPSGGRGVIVERDAWGGIELMGTLVGLQQSVSGGFHVHSGYTCASGDGVFGHYFLSGETDPWTASNDPPAIYTSDSGGVSNVQLTMPGFSLYGHKPVYLRAIVAHLEAGERYLCGVDGQLHMLNLAPPPPYPPPPLHPVAPPLHPVAPPPPSSSGLSGGAVAGIAIAVFAVGVLVGVGAAVYFLGKHRTASPRISEHSEAVEIQVPHEAKNLDMRCRTSRGSAISTHV